MYGRLTNDQLAAVGNVARGQVVHDLGAGSCCHTIALAGLGAKHVVALDKELRCRRRPLFPIEGLDVTYVEATFAYYERHGHPIDVAFVSWPEGCGVEGLSDLVARARIVIYVGKNTDGIMCGDSQFWQIVTGREVLSYVPHPKNTLIVYGPARATRELRGEEYAAVHNQKIWSYADVEQGKSTCVETIGI